MNDDPKKPSAMQHRVQILDPAGVQSVLKDLAAKYGSGARAANKIGIQPDTLANLLSGRVSSAMSFVTYASILAELGGRPTLLTGDPRPHGFSRILDAGPMTRPLDEASQQELDRRQLELDEEAQAQYELLQRFRRSLATDDQEWAWANYQEWVKRELARIKPRAEPILRELWDQKAYKQRRRFEDFLASVGRPRDELPPDEDLRCWLALYRAVDPLADATDTWGIERTWQELHETGELKAYLKASLSREALLMKHLRYLENVKRARPPMSYQEAMGQDAAREDFFEENPAATMEDWNARVAEWEADEG